MLRRAAGDDDGVARDVEAAVFATTTSVRDYLDRVTRCALNMRATPRNRRGAVAWAPDAELVVGTPLEARRHAEAERRARFERMLQEKYESLDDDTTAAAAPLLKCRRCNSMHISWDQKQTRSADESASVFCHCDTCGHRWIIR